MSSPENTETSCMDCGATGPFGALPHKDSCRYGAALRQIQHLSQDDDIVGGALCPRAVPTRDPRPSEAEIMAERVVGDVTSDARGSGARFNGGKPAVDLIPVWIIAATATASTRSDASGKRLDVYEAREILNELGEWQRGEVSALLVLQAFESDWIADAASVFDYGRKKYAAWNWAKGMPWSVPTACAVRHLLAILKGEINDPESDRPHRGHVACNIVMLAQYEKTYREGDDRPLKWLSSSAAKPAKPKRTYAEVLAAFGTLPEGPALNRTRDVSYRAVVNTTPQPPWSGRDTNIHWSDSI